MRTTHEDIDAFCREEDVESWWDCRSKSRRVRRFRRNDRSLDWEWGTGRIWLNGDWYQYRMTTPGELLGVLIQHFGTVGSEPAYWTRLRELEAMF